MPENSMDGRRGFLKKVGKSTIVGGVAATAISGAASAANRRYISITEVNGVEAEYIIEATTFRTPFWEKDVRGEGDLESNDTTATSGGDAAGHVNNGTDTWSFTGQLNSFNVAAGGGSEVRVELWGWDEYTDVNGVKITGSGTNSANTDGTATTTFNATGSVSDPNDGTLEASDVISGNYGESHIVAGGQDHFNFDGMPTDITMEPGVDFLTFNRYIAGEF